MVTLQKLNKEGKKTSDDHRRARKIETAKKKNKKKKIKDVLWHHDRE